MSTHPSKRARIAMDVSQLPDVVFGPRDIMWWGTFGFMMIEGFTLVLCAAVFVYLQQNAQAWPPPGTPLPSVGLPTLCLALMLASLPFMGWINRSAFRFELRNVRIGLSIASIWLLVIFIVRVAALLVSLNVNWDSNAYGSAQWLIAVAHGSLQLVELVEVAGVALVFWLAPIERKHFSDVSDIVYYWYFMTAAWVPLYILTIWVPRWI
jgi:cytochrome c oxidase subunit I+III